jgi:hypothetical protein
MGDSKMSHKKRKNKRDFAYGYVEISYKRKSARGVLINKSKNGIGTFIYKPLKIGANVEVTCNNHWEGKKQATVTWCEETGINLYTAGFSFN